MAARSMTVLVVALFALAPVRAFTVITIVDSDIGQTNTGSATTGTFNSTGATLLVAAVADYNGSTASVVSDDVSGCSAPCNTWTLVAAYTSATERIRILYAANPTVGTGHTCIAAGSTTYPTVACIAVAGATTTSPLDQHAGAGGTTPVSVGPVTPTENAELLVTAVAIETATDSGSAPSGYTLEQTLAGTANAYGLQVATLIQTTAGSSNPDWAIGIGDLAASVATFKVSGGGGGGGGAFPAGIINSPILMRWRQQR